MVRCSFGDGPRKHIYILPMARFFPLKSIETVKGNENTYIHLFPEIQRYASWWWLWESVWRWQSRQKAVSSLMEKDQDSDHDL